MFEANIERVFGVTVYITGAHTDQAMLPIANEEQGPGEAAMNGERCLMQLAIDETTVQLLDEGEEIGWRRC